MKFLKSLLGKDKDAAPTWQVKPASERPAGRPRQQLRVENKREANPPEPPKKAPDPFLDDPMLDTMTLEVDLRSGSEDDDPYSTHSWATGMENETRKLKTIQIGSKTEKSSSADYNPYDTGKMRRSWKR